MFEGPEHAPYLALMRKLELEHIFGPADFLAQVDAEGTVLAVHEAGSAFKDIATWSSLIWLPLLHDWLRVLEEVFAETWLEESGTPAPRGQARKMALDALAVRAGRFPGEPIEEAAARLWMAMAGRTVA